MSRRVKTWINATRTNFFAKKTTYSACIVLESSSSSENACFRCASLELSVPSAGCVILGPLSQICCCGLTAAGKLVQSSNLKGLRQFSPNSESSNLNVAICLVQTTQLGRPLCPYCAVVFCLDCLAGSFCTN